VLKAANDAVKRGGGGAQGALGKIPREEALVVHQEKKKAKEEIANTSTLDRASCCSKRYFINLSGKGKICKNTSEKRGTRRGQERKSDERKK